MNQQLQKVDIASLKSGDEVFVFIPTKKDHSLSGKIYFYNELVGDPCFYLAWVTNKETGKQDKVNVAHLYYPPSSQLENPTTPKEVIEYFKRTGTFPPRVVVDEITEPISFTPGQWDN